MNHCITTFFSAVLILTVTSFGIAAEPAVTVRGSESITGTAPKTEALKPGVRLHQSRELAHPERIDINAASIEQLKAISGIGDSYAGKIIAGRPYANKAQLKSRRILPENVYELVKTQIIARKLKPDLKNSDHLVTPE